MKHLPVSVLLFALTSHVAFAAEGIAFGPVRAQPGESVRLTSRSESRDGVVEITKDGKTSRETMRFYRERELSWTFREPAADGTRRGMVEVVKMATFTTTTIGGREEKTEDRSPLNGMMFAMSKAPQGDWTFELDGSIPRQRIQQEIDELTVYLKRRWYPERMVRVGDSWEFDPAWIRMILQKDLENAKLIGTMKLRQIRRSAKKDVAVIDVSVRGSGGNFQADGTEQNARIELKGQTTVDLKTMLDESLELDGVLETRSGRVSESKKANLPIRLVVNKSFVKGARF
jgi:hypothetical protein